MGASRLGLTHYIMAGFMLADTAATGEGGRTKTARATVRQVLISAVVLRLRGLMCRIGP